MISENAPVQDLAPGNEQTLPDSIQSEGDGAASFDAGAEAAAGAPAAEAAEDVVQPAIARPDTASDAARAFQEARDRLQKAGAPRLEDGQGPVAQLRAGAEDLAGPLAGHYEHASQAMVAFNTKVVEAWRANAEAAMAHWQHLAGVTTWSEMVALNAAHARKQIEVMTAQTRELADLTRRMGREGTGDLARRPD